MSASDVEDRLSAEPTREDGIEEAAALLESWAEADEAGQGDGDGEENLRHAAACIRALKDKAGTVPCICPGCTRSVEGYSRSRMCDPCAGADCDCLGPPEARATALTGCNCGIAILAGCPVHGGSISLVPTATGVAITTARCTCVGDTWMGDCPAHGLAGRVLR